MTSEVMNRANNYIPLTYLYSNNNIALFEIIQNISMHRCLVFLSLF